MPMGPENTDPDIPHTMTPEHNFDSDRPWARNKGFAGEPIYEALRPGAPSNEVSRELNDAQGAIDNLVDYYRRNPDFDIEWLKGMDAYKEAVAKKRDVYLTLVRDGDINDEEEKIEELMREYLRSNQPDIEVSDLIKDVRKLARAEEKYAKNTSIRPDGVDYENVCDGLIGNGVNAVSDSLKLDVARIEGDMDPAEMRELELAVLRNDYLPRTEEGFRDEYKKIIRRETTRRTGAQPGDRAANTPGDRAADRHDQDRQYVDRGVETWNDLQYLALQKAELWGTAHQNPIVRETQRHDNWPSYYERLYEQGRFDQSRMIELDRIDSRKELINAVNFKYSTKDVTLEALAGNKDMLGISKDQTKVLYEIPGVRVGLKEYIDLLGLEFDADGTMRQGEEPRLFPREKRGPDGRVIVGRDGQPEQEFYSLRECKDNTELQNYRNHIRGRLRQTVLEESRAGGRNLPDDPAQLDAALTVYSTDAEQVALGMLRLGNTFEPLDSVWEDGRRVRKPRISNALGAPIVRAEMKPLDGFLFNTLTEYKASDSVSSKANKLVTRNKRRLGIDTLTEFDEVVMLTNEDVGQFFKMEKTRDGKVRVYAPPCRPTLMLGSVWQETKIGDKTLFEYIRTGEQVPWETPGVQTLWSDYASKMDKVVKREAFLNGKKPLNWNDEVKTHNWTRELLKSYSDLKITRDVMLDYLVWDVAASSIVRVDESNEWKLFGNRAYIEHTLEKVTKLAPKKYLFFKTDKPSLADRFPIG